MRAQALLDEAAEQLGDSAKTYYTNAFLFEQLKWVVRDIVNRSRPIVREMSAQVTTDESDYTLPSDFLSLHIASYNDGRWYPLEPRNLADLERAQYAYGGGSQPAYYDFGKNGRVERATGAATGGLSTELDDTGGVDFTTLAISKTDIVLNDTDNSEARVDTIAATKITFMGTGLFGGVDNTFAALDTYRILSYDAPLKSVRIWPAPGKTDTVGVESLAVLYSAKHYDLQTKVDDLSIVPSAGNVAIDLELDEEFYTCIVEGLIFRGIRRRRGVSTESRLQRAEYDRRFREVLPQVKSRIEHEISTWGGGVKPIPGFAITVNGASFVVSK
mgnify:CR=1 FL=1